MENGEAGAAACAGAGWAATGGFSGSIAVARSACGCAGCGAGASKPNSLGSEIWKGDSAGLRRSGRRTVFESSSSFTMANGEAFFGASGAIAKGLGADGGEAGAAFWAADSGAMANGDGGGVPAWESWPGNVSKMPRGVLIIFLGVQADELGRFEISFVFP